MASMDTRADGGGADTPMTEFQFLFFSMGQGDCCIITCPDGRHIMVDCGSRPPEPDNSVHQVQQMLRGNWVFGLDYSVGAKLEALILTHPDLDHINKVTEILGGLNPTTRRPQEYIVSLPGGSTRTDTFEAIPVDKVFFSDFNRARAGFIGSPLGMYGANGAGGCNHTIYNNLSVRELHCVSLSAGVKTVDRWTPPFGESEHTSSILDVPEVTVARAADGSWSVSIIAGNVPRDRDDNSDNDGRNAASLVTLVRNGTQKIMLCGDASISTERYIKNHYNDVYLAGLRENLATIDLISVPHHGSDTTSSHDAFVDLVQPKMAVVSCRRHDQIFHLPAHDTVQKYLNYAEDGEIGEDHAIQWWVRTNLATVNAKKAQWDRDGDSYHTLRDNQHRPARYLLQDYRGDFDGTVMLDGFNTAGGRAKFYLDQTVTTKKVRMTSVGGHQWIWI